MIQLLTENSTAKLEPMNKDAPLRFKMKQAKPLAKVSLGMDLSFPGIVQEATAQHASNAFHLASYPLFQPKIQCYLYVASDPQVCCNYILASSAFMRKSKATLKRLAFSKRLSVRYAAEYEILRREIIDHYFPDGEGT
jgi:hypothetical protein